MAITTVTYLYDKVRQHHPDISEKEFFRYLNLAVADMVDACGGEHITKVITADGSAIAFDLAGTESRVQSVYCEGTEVYVKRTTTPLHEGMAGNGSEDYLWWIVANEGTYGKIYIVQDNTTISAIASGVEFTLVSGNEADELSSVTDKIPQVIPQHCQDGLAMYIIATGYDTPPGMDLQLASYFRGGFNKKRREAQKIARSGKRTVAVASPHWM